MPIATAKAIRPATAMDAAPPVSFDEGCIARLSRRAPAAAIRGLRWRIRTTATAPERPRPRPAVRNSHAGVSGEGGAASFHEYESFSTTLRRQPASVSTDEHAAGILARSLPRPAHVSTAHLQRRRPARRRARRTTACVARQPAGARAGAGAARGPEALAAG